MASRLTNQIETDLLHQAVVVVEHEKVLDPELIRDIKGRMILHWNYRNLKEIPAELLENGKHIKEIYLKRNCITTLPKDIGKLRNLSNLYLIANQLSILAPEIEQLANCLKVLDLSQNLLQTLPSNIGNLRNLEQLLLTNNLLASPLPKELGKLKKLKILELSGNKLPILQHDIIKGLQSLEEIALDGNPLTHLPRNIVLLPKLRYLSACKCKLLYLPSLPFRILINGRRSDGNYTSSMAVTYNSDENKPLTDFQILVDSNPDLNYLPYWIQFFTPNVEGFGCGFNVSTTKTNDQDNRMMHLSTPRVQHCGPKLSFGSLKKEHTLYFDEDLQKIHNESELNEDEPSSLLEQCIRIVYKEELYKHPWTNKVATIHEPLLEYSLRGPNSEDHFLSSAPDTLFDTSAIESNTPFTFQYGMKIDAKTSHSNPKPQSLSKLVVPVLPPNLGEILAKDVVSRCFSCMNPIFTEMWLMVFGVPLFDLRRRDDNLQEAPHQHQQGLLEIQNANEDNENKSLQISCIHLCSIACKAKLKLGKASKRNNFFMCKDFLKYEITNLKNIL